MSHGPSDELLIAYAAGELPESEAARVREALRHDGEARRLVELFLALRRTLAADDSQAPPEATLAKARAIFTRERVQTATPRPSLLEAVDRIIASLLFDSRLQPAVGFRSATQLVRLTFDCPLGEIDLEVTDDTVRGGEARRRIMGQMSTDDPARASLPLGLVATGTSSVVAETTSDEAGVFTLNVSPGCYDLCVRVGDRLIVAPEIRIE